LTGICGPNHIHNYSDETWLSSLVFTWTPTTVVFSSSESHYLQNSGQGLDHFH
jgi:hypothetical protein